MGQHKHQLLPRGVWPTMLTPFTESGQIDYAGLESLIEWYIEKGVHGLFAVCQSSEMFKLTLQERVELAAFVVERARGRVPVVASGHISDAVEDQVEEIRRIADTGIEAFVMVSNRLAAPDDSEEGWKRKADLILSQTSDIALGVYECPYPYKRVLSAELLQWCAETGRFAFLKDTCCDIGQIGAKLKAAEGTALQLFNANAGTLLDSLRLGAAGYSGIAANYYPEWCVWLCENWAAEPERAEAVQAFITVASLLELQYYPVNAKYHVQLEGVPITLATRVKEAADFKPSQRVEVEQMRQLAAVLKKSLQL